MLHSTRHGKLRTMRIEPDVPAGMSDAATPESAAFLMHRVVGSGGFGDVWEGLQVSLDRKVAIKRLRASLYSQKKQQEMQALEAQFELEALITGQLDHPNIVPVYDLGIDEEGHPLLAMKFVDGTPWADKIIEDRELSCADRLARHLPILISVTQAVAFAHSRGVIHRDIKPGQVMIGRFGEVYLMDWGLAAAFSGREQFTVPLQDAPNPAGTIAFMAPEQTQNTAENLGPWTDVWLLGATLYLLLALSPPHRQDNSTDAWDHAVRGMVEPAHERSPDQEIPSQLSSLCQQAMATATTQRVKITEFLRALENYLTGRSRIEESNKLLGQAKQMLASAEGSYEELSRCDTILRRAMAMWPDNPEGERFEQELVRDFVDTALARGDLGLARFQSMRLLNPPDRRQFMQRVETLEKRKKSQERQRRVATRVLVVLLLAAPTAWAAQLYMKQRPATNERRPAVPAGFKPVTVPKPRNPLDQM